ncbi:MAG: DNA-processing protein DprA, partial [Micrococcales bacterium]|nr:DNA-processing protein DprA [Micrococcales bacterium]
GSSVAIVGARAATAYGEAVAAELAVDLGEANVCVVSGGAYGIDSSAHRGCLASRTPTVAVLAGGLDQAYPPAHASLFDRIATSGLLVSELPPGEHPTRVRFLGRNRLIAALTPGVVLVEAAVRSGARNTMSWATALNRVAMAVPGPVTSATSYTPHRLIREAEAVLVTTAVEIRELLGPLGRDVPRPPAEQRVTDSLTATELRVYEAIPGRGGLAAEEIALRADVTLPQALGVLNSLADRCLVVQTPLLDWGLAPRRRIPAQPVTAAMAGTGVVIATRSRGMAVDMRAEG